ncbi:MAG: hypothetical protein ABL879_10320 [Devosia sp.]
MLASRIVQVPIRKPFGQVYEFLADPMNFARWASVPGTEVEPLGDGTYLVEVPTGQVAIRFAPRNSFGVLDYQAYWPNTPNGRVVPVRLYPNGDGCELIYTVMQHPDVTDEKFASDIEWIESDLNRLKALVEQL